MQTLLAFGDYRQLQYSEHCNLEIKIMFSPITPFWAVI